MQRGGYPQPDKPANPTPPSQRGSTAADVAKAIDRMAETLAGYAVELAGMRNARYADPLDRERAKVAHLRARVIGMHRALREAHERVATWRGAARANGQDASELERLVDGALAEVKNQVRITAKYREAAEVLVVRAERLEAIAREALDEWADALPYIGEYLVMKWGYHERIAELRAELAGAPRAPAEPVAEEIPDLAAQLVRVLEANGVDPSRATAREIQTAMDAVGMIGQVEARTERPGVGAPAAPRGAR